jgi:phage recombination protein Bet
VSNALVALTNKLAARFDMEQNGQELYSTLKATVFKGNVSDAQMTALLIVANQYTLNPWTKEIYAFPDKNNGIVPVVGVDGWSRIINDNPQFDGMDFEQDDESCTCIIYRKDRNHPIKVTEYMAECRRANVGPWQSHPRRMLRHKAMIQCARLAFGFAGIYDQDEAERIISPEPVPEGVDLSPIQNAATMQDLQAAFATAWKATTDARVRKLLTDAKDARKQELMNAPIDVNPETGEVIDHAAAHA